MSSEVVSAKREAGIKKAASILAAGGVVAFPTETVYGLGADAFDSKAVARVFEIKKRPSFDPLIVHIADPGQTQKLWNGTPPLAQTLIKAFWPGPLTLVSAKRAEVPNIVTAGLSTIAVRMPRHPAALELIRRSGTLVAAPSANLFGRTSPTTAEAVAEQLREGPDMILDGGATEVGLESTVVKIEGEKCVILRPGGVTAEELARYAKVEIRVQTGGDAPEAPGQMKSHYATETPFYLMGSTPLDFVKTINIAKKRCQSSDRPWPRVGCLLFRENIRTAACVAQVVLSGKGDLCEAASKLFDAMRKLDKMGLDMIIAEGLPEEGLGSAIMDRLGKAASGRTVTEKTFERETREKKK